MTGPRNEGQEPAPRLLPENAPEAAYGQLLSFMLRTAQAHVLQLSAMADVKANILMTIAAIVLTLSVARFQNPDVRASMLVLAAFSLASLVLAVLAVLPTAATPSRRTGEFDRDANLLFFGHFSAISEDEYVERMKGVIDSGDSIVRAQLRDIHQGGWYLQHHKFRYLRYAYVLFLAGIFMAGLTQLVVVVLDAAR